jgi:hypothetical protein
MPATIPSPLFHPSFHTRLLQLLAAVLLCLATGCADVPADAPAQCDLGQLTPSATWTGLRDAALLGQLTMTNYTTLPCPLNGAASLSLLDENQLPLDVVFQSDHAAFYESLQPGQTLKLSFTWNNWCGASPTGGLILRLELSETSGTFEAAFQDPNGQPLQDTPRCSDAAQPSLLLLGDAID